MRGLSVLSTTIKTGTTASAASVTCHDRRHHRGDDHDEQRHVGRDGGERADGGLRADDVGVHAVEQRAGLRAREERERELLHVLEHAHAQSRR